MKELSGRVDERKWVKERVKELGEERGEGGNMEGALKQH